MDLNVKQLEYPEDSDIKFFDSDSEDFKLISIDEAILADEYHKEDSSDEKVLSYMNRGNKVLYDYMVTLDGTIYKITPPHKRGNASKFNLYSSRMCKELPDLCPLYELEDENAAPPDVKVVSICVESSIKSNVPTNKQKYSLEHLLAYLFKKYTIHASKLITRNMIPKEEKKKREIGHKHFSDGVVISNLILLASHGLSIDEKDDITIIESPLQVPKR